MAFALGAIVSPTDPAAATAIMRRVGAPRRLVNVLEGESLFNDATALVAYKVAVAAAVGGSVSAGHTVLEFAAEAGGGIAIGLAVGWAIGAGPQARDRHQHRADDLALQRLRRVRPRQRGRCLRRPGRGRLRRLPRVAGAGDLLAREPDGGLRAVVGARLPAQRGPVHPHRPAAAGDRRRARGPPGGRGDRLRGGRLRDGDRGPLPVELPRDLPRSDARSAAVAGRTPRELAQPRGRVLGRDARRRLAGRGARAPAPHRRRRPAPRPRADPVHDLRADPRHRRRAGPDAAVADPPARRRRGRRRGGERGDPRAAGDRPRRARPRRRARSRGVDARRHHRADAQALRVPPAALQDPRRRRSRTRTGSRRARCSTSG